MMDHEHNYHVLLGTNSMRGSQGLYHIAISKADLSIRVLHTCPALNGDYLWLSPDQQTVYVAYEVIYFDDQPTAAVAAYRIGSDGALTLLNTQNTDGQMACFCSVDRSGTHLLSSSYMGGSVTITPILPDGSLGAPNEVIQQPVRAGMHWPSVHSVYETPDGRFVLSTNVGLDRVFLHRRTERDWEQAFELPVAGRPRQAAFSADHRFIYVSTEAGGEVYVLAYQPEERELLRTVQIISTTPAGWHGHAETAGIKLSPDGKLLVVANRAPELNQLARFAVDPATGLLTYAGSTPVSGVFPRDLDFSPDGRLLLVGLQFSDQLELFSVDTERTALTSLRSDFHLPCCSGVKFIQPGGHRHA